MTVNNLLANNAKLGDFNFSNNVFTSDNSKLSMNSNTGKFICTDAEITGAITATSGSFTGEITSTQGLIGGIKINGNGLGTPGSQVWEGHPGMFLCPTYIDFTSADTVYVGQTQVPTLSSSKLTSYRLEISNPVVGNGITEVLKLICGDIGFKVTSNGIFKSTDGGTNWTAM